MKFQREYVAKTYFLYWARQKSNTVKLASIGLAYLRREITVYLRAAQGVKVREPA